MFLWIACVTRLYLRCTTLAEFTSYIWRLSNVSTSANDPCLSVSLLIIFTLNLMVINFQSLNAPLSSFRTQAKKRKTGGSTPIIISEPIKEPAPIQDNPDQDKPEDQVDLPSSPKETMDAPKPPSPLTTTEDPDAVIITGTSFSKPATTVLSKHVSS